MRAASRLSAVYAAGHIVGLAVLIMLALEVPDVQAARDVAEQRECATCHIMWLNAFKREDVSTLIPYDPRPIVDTGQQDVTSTSLMCLSCHDGFMLDSRALWKDGHKEHPVGVVPSDAIARPLVDDKNLFPLNDDGKVYCGTCHTAHGVDWEATDSPVFMRVRSRDGELCQACHVDRLKGAVSGNHPVDVAVDPKALEAGARHLSLSTDGKVTCQSCHTAHLAADDQLLVVANDNSELCGTCHLPQNAATLQIAAGTGTHPVNILPARAQVAAELLDQGGRLGDQGKLICQSRHTPHKAQSEDAILVVGNAGSALCRDCHQKESRVIGGRHDLSADADANADGGVCSACHVAHGGSGPKMWARKVPADTDAMSALCLGCHTRGAVAERHQVGEYSHPVGVDAAVLGRPVDLPTFTVQGIRVGTRAGETDAGMVVCSSCHDVHQWDPAHAGRVPEPGQDGDAGNSFLRRANDQGSALCRECHEDKWQLAETDHDVAVSLPASTNAAGIPATDAGLCGSCHRTHNGLGPAMWARSAPADAPPAAAACLSCHGEKGPADARTLDRHSHPVGVSVGKLDISIDAHGWSSAVERIDGSPALIPLPLYDEYGNAAPDGELVGCASCHDPHSSPDTDGRIGNFLRIVDTGRDELCVNCHVEKDLVRLSPHGREQEDMEGVCMSCHRAHMGEADYMWAKTTGPGQQPVEQLCSSCHQDGGDAGDKLTGRYSHPVGVAADDGSSVDCTSCHDPHQWDPNDPLSREGLKSRVEGDITTSFLRIGDEHGGLCAECHEGYSDVLGTDHDLRITAADAVNLSGQTVSEAGLCGQCHTPHNAGSQRALWARESIEGPQQGDGFCLGCHSRKGVADEKVPEEGGHPQEVLAWSSGGIPVFKEQSDSGKLGEIGCYSCHNPHRWSSDSSVTAAGSNIEGDVHSSFLRLQSTKNFLCADCHGKDALFRYLYFHSPRSRSRN